MHYKGSALYKFFINIVFHPMAGQAFCRFLPGSIRALLDHTTKKPQKQYYILESLKFTKY